MLYEAARDDLNEAIALMDEMKENDYDVSLTGVLIVNLYIALEDAIESVGRKTSDVAKTISYLQ